MQKRSDPRSRTRRQSKMRIADVFLVDPSLRYKHNGNRRVGWRDDGPDASIPSCLSVYVDVYRHHWTLFARYCNEGRCSEKQLRTVDALFIQGVSAQEFAKAENVSVEAIRSRIQGLANKCPEFYRWWRGLHRGRQRSTRPSRKRRPEIENE
jgi:hypothetical protein